MSTTSPVNGLPLPDDNSPNDPPLHFLGFSNVLDSRVPGRFATTSARDAAWSAWQTANSGAPIPNGSVAWCDSPGYFFDRIGGAWVARTHPRLINAFAPVYGSLPSSYLPLMQAGTASMITNASAVGSFDWPVSFPGGVITVQLTPLTDTVTQLRLVGSGGTDTSTCQFVARKTDGSPAVSTTVTLTYLAYGW